MKSFMIQAPGLQHLIALDCLMMNERDSRLENYKDRRDKQKKTNTGDKGKLNNRQKQRKTEDIEKLNNRQKQRKRVLYTKATNTLV